MSKTYRWISAIITLPLALWLLLFATTGTVSAHAKVIKATPDIGSTITAIPSTVSVVTAENMDPDPKSSNLFVYGPDGELVSQGDAKVSLNNPTEMSISIKGDKQGVYIVRWITKSADDGDDAQGAFIFTVSATGAAATPTIAAIQPTAPPTSDQANAPTSNNAGFPVLPVSIIGIIALLVGLGAGFALGRSRPKTTP